MNPCGFLPLIASKTFLVCRIFAAGFLLGGSSFALVVDDVTTQNLDAPTNGAPWGNVGAGNYASGVYLKNGWVVSAQHVFSGGNSPAIQFGGVLYTGGQVFVLTNPDGTPSDVVLFNIGSAPGGTSEINIPSETPGYSSAFTMIGYGAKRSGGLTNISYTGGTAKGYPWDGNVGSSKSWGASTRAAFAVTEVQVPGFNAFQALVTLFTANGSSRTAEAAAGDSGGGVFYRANGSWQLAGIMNAIGDPKDRDGQPDSTAMDGNGTYIANLSSYATQINNRVVAGNNPTVTSASPAFLIASNNAGTITLSGSHFVNGSKVQVASAANPNAFSDTPSAAVYGNDTTLTVALTASAADTWKLRVLNPDGRPGGAISLPIYPAKTFSDWSKMYPSLTDDAALPAADPDGDGLSNLQEYAFGSDPTSPTSANAPAFTTEQGNLALTYTKDLAKTDVTYTAQTTTDLTQPWTNVSDTLLESSGTTERRKVSVPISGERAFLRIQVVK